MASRTMMSPNLDGNAGSSIAGSSSRPSSISRQASIFSLTLDEIQNVLNEPLKNFGSMNMDEFLKNIWTAEESAAVAVAMQKGNNGEKASSLHRQGSLNLPRTLSRKTVEEVWQDIHHNSSEPPPADLRKRQRRQPTFGEMTLEDFLTRAGVVREKNDSSQLPVNNSEITHPNTNLNPPSMEAFASPSLQNAGWFGYARPHQQLLQQTEAAAALANAGLSLAVYDGLSDGARLRPGAIANSLTLSPAVSDSPPVSGRRRGDPESLFEKSIERRQRRMIKNRESAARSRARKQAYTVELEAEVTQLKEENARLKKQQALERQLPLAPVPQEPVRVLRRTRSTSW